MSGLSIVAARRAERRTGSSLNWPQTLTGRSPAAYRGRLRQEAEAGHVEQGERRAFGDGVRG